MDKMHCIDFQVSREGMRLFCTLLQHGCILPLAAPLSILDLLTTLPGFDPAYIHNELKTIFINGVPIDSLEDMVHPGDTLALSAAMPGLAGAIFRKQGPHSTLRSKATPHPNALTDATDPRVYIKLFNTVGIHCGPALFGKGVVLDTGCCKRFLQHHRQDLMQSCLTIHQQGQQLTPEQLSHILGSQQTVLLRIEVM
jgi:hypothetical protein